MAIRTDIEVDALRRQARLEADGRVAAGLFAIGNALSGMSSQAAAEAAGMDRQTLADWGIASTPTTSPVFAIGRDPDDARGSAMANRRS